jgi:hypothetical protein
MNGCAHTVPIICWAKRRFGDENNEKHYPGEEDSRRKVNGAHPDESIIHDVLVPKKPWSLADTKRERALGSVRIRCQSPPYHDVSSVAQWRQRNPHRLAVARIEVGIRLVDALANGITDDDGAK